MESVEIRSYYLLFQNKTGAGRRAGGIEEAPPLSPNWQPPSTQPPRPAETRDDRRRIEASYWSSQPDCCIKEVTRCVKLLRTELLLQYQYQSYEITTTICSNSTSRDSSQPSIASCVGKCWWLMCRFCVIRKKLSCHYSLSQNELLGLTESSQIPTYPAKVCWKFGLSSTVYKRLAQALIFDFLFETSWNICAHISRINVERVDDRISSFKLSFRFWAACPAQRWICDTIDSIRCRCARCLACSCPVLLHVRLMWSLLFADVR